MPKREMPERDSHKFQSFLELVRDRVDIIGHPGQNDLIDDEDVYHQFSKNIYAAQAADRLIRSSGKAK